ncbi:restriction endonuclease subunit S [Proteiniphilum sp.]|uniref:restriction endonuclease subunit S n=1 Tax=Proteiniphilum sp. TaxID=1926877 RepID=UPI002B20631E|nr:restriction endonuclease subunit S [Proteiniphilum sp.]
MKQDKKKEANVPNLRFPGFEGEWEEKKLESIATFFSGGTPKTTVKKYYNGNIPFIRSGEINSDSTELYISKEGLKNSSAKLINKGDLLIALYGATSGEIAISKIRGAINQAILCVSTVQNKLFIQAVWLKYIDKILQNYLQGGQGNLSANIIKHLKFHFPNNDEQNKIATFISLLDKRISTQNKIIKQYKSLIKELSEKIFSRSFHFKDTVGNDFPNWEDKVLGEIGESFNGLSGKTKEDFGKGKLYIQYKQIFDSPIIDVLNCGLVNITRVEFQNKVQFGDIFFTVSSETPDEIGMSSVLLDKVSEMYLNSFCFAYRVFSFDILNPLFASYLFRCSLFRDKLIRIAQGSTRYNISKVEFMKLKISLPSIREQVIIASFLSTLDEKIKIEKKMLEQYANQRNYLLYRMFI